MLKNFPEGLDIVVLEGLDCCRSRVSHAVNGTGTGEWISNANLCPTFALKNILNKFIMDDHIAWLG